MGYWSLVGNFSMYIHFAALLVYDLAGVYKKEIQGLTVTLFVFSQEQKNSKRPRDGKFYILLAFHYFHFHFVSFILLHSFTPYFLQLLLLLLLTPASFASTARRSFGCTLSSFLPSTFLSLLSLCFIGVSHRDLIPQYLFA